MKTIGGIGAIVFGTVTLPGGAPLLAGGIPIVAEGGALLFIEFGLNGDTSGIPSTWEVMGEVGKGIVENLPTGDNACTTK